MSCCPWLLVGLGERINEHPLTGTLSEPHRLGQVSQFCTCYTQVGKFPRGHSQQKALCLLCREFQGEDHASRPHGPHHDSTGKAKQDPTRAEESLLLGLGKQREGPIE